jgi:hypothetical protein
MFTKSTTEAQYRYKGDSYGFYKRGETYYLTVTVKKFLFWGWVEVSCRRGGKDQIYPYSQTFIYRDRLQFRKDWKKC